MMEADGLDLLITDLSRAGLLTGAKIARELDSSGERMVDDARRLAPSRRLPHYANTITHEVQIGKRQIEVVVGPEKRGQGKLGHILERGSASSPPHAHLGPSLDLEGPRAERALGDIVGEL